MICEIMKDELFLSFPSAPATAEDAEIGQNLLDTLEAHKDGCVGMAANMIGCAKRIIAFEDGNGYTLMYNPEIIRKSEPYDAVEGCLSLAGTRPAKRYKTIRLSYLDAQFRPRIKTYTGFTAQIIQHEIDHCNGILI